MPQVETDVFERLVRPYGTLDRATRWIAFVGLVGLVIVSMVIVLDIVMRGVFSHPLEGLEEITKFVFAIVIASCFPAGLVQGQNVAIRFLGSGLGPKAANWLEVLASACTLLFCLPLLASRDLHGGRGRRRPLYPDPATPHRALLDHHHGDPVHLIARAGRRPRGPFEAGREGRDARA